MAITLAEDIARADLIIKYRRIKIAIALILGAFFMFAAGVLTDLRINGDELEAVRWSMKVG